MSLDIKAGVLTLISPLMEINTLSFVHSLSYKLISSLINILHLLCCIASCTLPPAPVPPAVYSLHIS